MLAPLFDQAAGIVQEEFPVSNLESSLSAYKILRQHKIVTDSSPIHIKTAKLFLL